MNISEEKRKIQFALNQLIDVNEGESAIIIIGNQKGAASVKVGDNENLSIAIATIMCLDKDDADVIERAELLYNCHKLQHL